MERTFVMVKPDGVQRSLIGEIIRRLEHRGLKLVGLKMVQVSREFAEAHYAVHKGKPFFAGLIQYITSAPVVAMVVEGTNAIQAVRQTVGATRPYKQRPAPSAPTSRWRSAATWCMPATARKPPKPRSHYGSAPIRRLAARCRSLALRVKGAARTACPPVRPARVIATDAHIPPSRWIVGFG